jgi:radical SAM-linked protein
LRYKVAIRFAISGDLRFVSHHDTMRLFERALARAGLPVAFSAGFNPRPKLTLPLPRAVGMAAQGDLLVIQLTDRLAPEEVASRLAGQMPEGVGIDGAWELPPGGSVHPERAVYEVTLSHEVCDAVDEAVARFRAADQWLIHRESGRGRKRQSGGKTIDLKAYVCEPSVTDNVLSWIVRVTAEGSARPAEVLAALGLEPEAWRHRVRRTFIHWHLQRGPSVKSADGNRNEPEGPEPPRAACQEC